MQEPPSGWSRRRFLTLTGMAGLSLAACAARVPAHGGQTQAVTGSALENAARDHPVALINRLTWGATQGDLNSLRQRGVGHYVNAQLRPPADPVLPPEVVAQLQAMTINRTPVADLAREAAEQQLLYALYSPNQLQEQLTWFWMNHFSVFQFKGILRPMMGDYYARVIKPHALGRFRDLLRATVSARKCLFTWTTPTTRAVISTKITRARSWNCTRWVWTRAIPSRM